MTYKEFRESGLWKDNGWWIVTLAKNPEKPNEELFVEVLMWEASNYKWYHPTPMYGREEIGYTDEVYEKEDNLKIVHIRPL